VLPPVSDADFSVLDPMDQTTFRRSLGRFASGLTVVTSCHEGRRVGMTCQAFTSVSLDPPLVGLFVTPDSGTLWAVRNCKKFCINVLSEHQVDVARIFALSGADKFKDVPENTSPHGSPMIPDCVAWFDCELESEFAAGDHVGLLGRVKGLANGVDTPPAVYFRGGYGKFAS
jgi:3-hydroxy-9,10-secoandrosta-1,3,5(10)-triene-9,17-dione monooxygenase reductase component